MMFSFVLGCATLLGFFRLLLAANCVSMFWGCSDGFWVLLDCFRMSRLSLDV